MPEKVFPPKIYCTGGNFLRRRELDKIKMASIIDKTRQDKTRQDKTRQDKTTYCFLSDGSNSYHNFYPLIFVFLSSFCFWWLLHDGLNWTDFAGQWSFGAYTLQGTDIYSLRGTESVGAGFHASPWGLLLGNIFYCGFLPLEIAKIYYLVVNAVVLFAVSFLLYTKINDINHNLALWSLLISVLSVDFLMAVHEGNAGAMISAFLVAAWVISNEHKYISGILIGFGMVKPQVAVIVCLFFLMEKHFVPLIVGAVIDVLAWFVVSLLTHRGMYELIYEFLFSSGRAESGPFAGIFTLTTNNFMLSVVLSMAAGIIFMYALKKSLPGHLPEIFRVYPALMAITFWCYSWVSDFYVLIIPICVCIWLLMKTGNIFWLICCLYCNYGLAVRSAINRILKVLTRNPELSWHIPRTIYELGIIAVGIVMCIELRRVYGREAS